MSTGELPRVVIERTPANDVHLLLSALGAEAALADPIGFARDNRVELRTVAELLRARLSPPPPPEPPAPEPPARRAPPKVTGSLLR